MRLALVLASLGVAAAQPSSDVCLERYQCIFHHDVKGVEWSWDMHQLCKPNGDYLVNMTLFNQQFYFNVCGNTTQVCADGTPMYAAHGAAIQYFGQYPSQPICYDVDFNASVPCTRECEVLASPFLQFELADINNPATGGVKLVHIGMPPDPMDTQAQCPPNALGLPLQRQLAMHIDCDPRGRSNQLDIVMDPATGMPKYSESPSCYYHLYLKSKAACGVKGDPFDGYWDDPAHSFGFVVLGWVIAVIVYYAYTFGNDRGWWDPIREKLSVIPFIGIIPCCRSAGYSSSKKTSYGNVSGGAASSNSPSAALYGAA